MCSMENRSTCACAWVWLPPPFLHANGYTPVVNLILSAENSKLSARGSTTEEPSPRTSRIDDDDDKVPALQTWRPVMNAIQQGKSETNTNSSVHMIFDRRLYSRFQNVLAELIVLMKSWLDFDGYAFVCCNLFKSIHVVPARTRHGHHRITRRAASLWFNDLCPCSVLLMFDV